jgi:bacterioferritin
MIVGTKGREIVGTDLGELIEKLSSAFADEWLAYYQYWVGARIAEGPMRGIVAAELVEHAGEELGHAERLAERIIQLGGKPVLNPEDWGKLTTCGYEAPEDPYVATLLGQNIRAEQCAIKVYQELMQITKEVDPITYNLALEIMTDEVEHEDELEAIAADLAFMKQTTR